MSRDTDGLWQRIGTSSQALVFHVSVVRQLYKYSFDYLNNSPTLMVIRVLWNGRKYQILTQTSNNGVGVPSIVRVSWYSTEYRISVLHV